VARSLRTAACAALLAGPAVVGFFDGGYFDEPRLWMGIGAWTLVGVAALTVPAPLLPGRPARVALIGLALLAAWVAVSLTWAPLGSRAFDDLQRLVAYLGALLAAAILLRHRRSAGAAEPAIALGLVALVLYGLSERLLPGVVDLEQGQRSFGRLDQPLTYWNAMGLAAGLGVVLAARLAGDRTRPASIRVAAAALAGPLGTGVYLSFSRGAIAAVATGTIVLLALAPTRPQLRAVVLVLAAGLVCAVTASLLPTVESLADGDAESEGALMLGVLCAAGAVAALAQWRLARGEATGTISAAGLEPPRWSRPAVLAALVAVVAVGAVLAASTSGPPATGAAPERLGSLDTPRYDYWEVALRSFADDPFKGAGAGGFLVDWRRERDVSEGASDAHSLYLETAAELGLAGLGLLAVFLGGVVAAARRAYRVAPAPAAGPIAALAAWTLHAGLDWDWEMPGVTLPALVLAGVLLACSTGEREPEPPRAS
jgi:hypothetical protein